MKDLAAVEAGPQRREATVTLPLRHLIQNSTSVPKNHWELLFRKRGDN